MPTPHDALFRHTFGDPQHAGPLLRALLHPAIVAAIDWSTLRRVPDVAIDEAQREQRADLLFAVRMRAAAPRSCGSCPSTRAGPIRGRRCRCSATR
jgi:hypothetical protein